MEIHPIISYDPQQGALARTVPSTSMPEVAPPRFNPLLMLWRRRNVLAIILLVCIGAAWALYLLTPAVYRSKARLFVQTASLKSGPESADSTTLQTQCELIRSNTLLAELIGNPEIARMRTLESGQRGTVLKDNLQATVGKDNDIITLSFDSPYPREAREILQAVINAYQSFHGTEKRAKVAKLETWRKKHQIDLDEKQKALLKFKKEHGALSLTTEKGGNIALQSLATLQDAVTTAQVDTINARSALDTTKRKLGDPSQLKQLVDYLRSSGAITATDQQENALRSQLLAMEQQMDELRRRYLAGHPAVRAGEATIADIRARLAEHERNLAQGHLIALEQKLLAAESRESELRASLEKQMKAALELSSLAAEYEKLDNEVKSLARTVESADLKIIDMTSAESVGAPLIQVFDEPSDPSSPIRPSRSRMLLQGLLIGLALGLGAAVVIDLTDQGLRSSDEIARALGAPLLGSLPHIPGPPNPLASARKVDLEPSSDVAETYRAIRTAVFFGTPDRESRTILVTSPAPGEGRSTFASNLAIAMAQAGKRILLVDADFRVPVQHRVFECRPGMGLSTVLTGKDALDQALQVSGIASLDILPSGPAPTNPAEILNSQSFAELLEELSVRYEHVVIDAPAVLGAADARILAAMCSVTLLVTRAGRCTRKSAQHARRALQSVGAHVLGIVVNDVPAADDPYTRATARARWAAPDLSPRTSAPIPPHSFLDLRRK